MEVFFSGIKNDLLKIVQTPFGKLFIVVFFSTVLWAYNISWWPSRALVDSSQWWIAVAIALLGTTFFPKYRRHIFATAGVIGWFYLPWYHLSKFANTQFAPSFTAFLRTVPELAVAIGAVLLFSAMYLALCRYMARFKWWRPILILLIINLLALMLVARDGAFYSNQFMFYFVSVLVVFFWYFCYTINEIHKHDYKGLLKQFKYYLPFWGGASVPFAKGKTYLDRVEVKTAEDLASTQLSGLYLLGLSIFWYVIHTSLWNMRLRLHIPLIHDVFIRLDYYKHYSVLFYWQVMIFNMLSWVLYYAINSHIIIGIARMAGFNAARNMDSPFLSSSLIEFWNRYSYYFKELLVDVFFYPTYFLCFKKYPRVRLVLATFMAACIGNIIYHFTTAVPFMRVFGFWKTLYMLLQSYGFYTFLLAFGISISQLRQYNRKAPLAWWRRRILGPITTICFFGLLSVFLVEFASPSVLINFKFLGRMFGL